MACHRSKQDKTQAKTKALGEALRGALGRTLSASLLRTVTGGDSGEASLAPTQTPEPPPPTAG